MEHPSKRPESVPKKIQSWSESCARFQDPQAEGFVQATQREKDILERAQSTSKLLRESVTKGTAAAKQVRRPSWAAAAPSSAGADSAATGSDGGSGSKEDGGDVAVLAKRLGDLTAGIQRVSEATGPTCFLTALDSFRLKGLTNAGNGHTVVFPDALLCEGLPVIRKTRWLSSKHFEHCKISPVEGKISHQCGDRYGGRRCAGGRAERQGGRELPAVWICWRGQCGGGEAAGPHA